MLVLSVSLLARTHPGQPYIPAASFSCDFEKCSHHPLSSRYGDRINRTGFVFERASGEGISIVGIDLQASGDSNPDISRRGQAYAGRQSHYEKRA